MHSLPRQRPTDAFFDLSYASIDVISSCSLNLLNLFGCALSCFADAVIIMPLFMRTLNQFGFGSRKERKND